MTEKRFKFVCDDENCFFKDNNKVLYCYEVIDLLNELNDDKETLFDTVKKADNLIHRFGSEELKHQWKKAVTIKYR